ncbi:hypothetical protein ACTHQ1_06275 [Janibacter anophelis]|uniref:hypothetical protein n=1 Tax=Janibacter anophelis TaxID=319054 RepID=UPI003F7FD120
MRRAIPALAATVVGAVLLTGCVTPALDSGAFRHNARGAVGSGLSETSTAALTVEQVLAGRLTDAVADTSLSNCEDAIGPIEDSFGKVQPRHVTAVLVGPRLMGSSLGYSSDEQDGPWAISWVVGRLHRTAHWRDRREIASISWTGRRIDLSTDR